MNTYKIAHWELWDYLAMNPKAEKKDWPGWKWNGGEFNKITNNCFACEIAGIANAHGYFAPDFVDGPTDEYVMERCASCPLLTGAEFVPCNTKGGTWDKWIDAKRPKRRAELATIIRDAWGDR